MRTLLLGLVAGLALSPSVASASCIATGPEPCLCGYETPEAVVEAEVVEVSDSATTAEVLAVHGDASLASVGDQIDLPQSSDDVVGEERIVHLGQGGVTFLVPGPVPESGIVTCPYTDFQIGVADAIALGLEPDCVARAEARGLVQAPCNDNPSAFGCAAAGGGAGWLALGLVLVAIRRRVG